MIISKNSLQIVKLCLPDKNIPQLNCVCITPDGAVYAANSHCTGVVSPLSKEQVGLIPLTNNIVHEPIILSADNVRTILNNIPKDTQFKGLLEHCDIDLNDASDQKIDVVITNGKAENKLTMRRFARSFPINLDVAFKGCNQLLKPMELVCINRKRLGNIQVVLDKVCSYDGTFAPVWLYCIDDRIMLRSVNELTRQTVIFLFPPSETDFFPFTPFELQLFGQRKAIKIK